MSFLSVRVPIMTILLLLLIFSVCNAQAGTNSTFQVGVVLDLNSLVARMGMTSLSLALSDFYTVNPNYTTKLVLHVRDSDGQAMDAAASALNLLDGEVDAIIGPQKSSQASFVIGLGDRANVPIISFSATSATITPQTPYFVQAALVDAAQVGAVAAIVEYFHWNQVVVIYEESDFGNGIIPYLSNSLQDVNARISYRSSIPTAATADMMHNELLKMKTMQTRVFVVHMSSAVASRFFLKVKEAGMMTEGYAWIVTSSVMDLLYSLDPLVVDAMQGALGVKPLIPRTKKLKNTARRWKRKFVHDNPEFPQSEMGLYGVWAYDTLWALAMAAERVQFREPSSLVNSSVLNSTNPFTTKVSQTGPKILEAILGLTFEGLAGNFHLFKGQLEPSSFQILNVIGRGEREVGIWTPSQGILGVEVSANSNSSTKKMKTIVFPGDSTNPPKGWEIPVSGTKLKILVPVEAGFPEMVKVEKHPVTNHSIISGAYIDIFDAVIKAVPYAIRYEYFPFEKPDGSSAGTYDDCTRQVSLQNYDGAVGDISITSNRSKYVDFTLPFNSGGYGMVVQAKRNNPNDAWVFLKPFSAELWLTTLALFIFTGAGLWILERRSNSAYRGSNYNHVGLILYFPFMSLVYAQRERIVTNFARTVVVVWVFVVFILNSTYTASLSARLTVQRLQPVVHDMDELIRNGDYIGCHDGAFVCDIMHAKGFDKSKILGFKRPEDVNAAFVKGSKKGGISALFSTLPYTNMFIAKYCEKYTRVGPTYPVEGFAYAFPKGSPLVSDISRAVIELTESGRMSEIEGQLMKDRNCSGSDSTDTRISLKSFQGIFIMTGVVTLLCILASLGFYWFDHRDALRNILNDSNRTLWSKVHGIWVHFNRISREGNDNICQPSEPPSPERQPSQPPSPKRQPSQPPSPQRQMSEPPSPSQQLLSPPQHYYQ